MTHKGTQIIRTKRLVLRPFTIEDASAMFHNWASDERVTRFLTWLPHRSMQETETLLTEWCAAYKNPTVYNWGIEYKNKLVGGTSIVRLDEQSEIAEIGYCIGHDFWGNGITAEATSAVIAYSFSEIGVNRIVISHAVQNPASGRVAQKCGLTYEGTSRQAYKTRTGEYLDIAHYSILRREFDRIKA